jgi:Na+/proline symporter
VLAAFFSVREVGGLGELLAQPAVVDRMTFLPDFGDPAVAVPLFFVPLAVQWWAAWYPGAEPGGGGYVAQRMLAARNENHAVAATLAFNVAHYALRPWPWILVALASLVVYPDVESLSRAFPGVDRSVVSDDLAYSAMLTFLPVGVKGLVVASLAAAYMSTISTHLNWGASYCAYDLYRRFVRPEAQERELVAVGRAATVVLMLLASLMALQLEDAVQAFQLLLQIGAGTGLLFILRWFWWRINAWSEIAAMVSSFLVALFFALGPDVGLAAWQELVVGVGTTTVVWLTATLLTRPTHEAKLLDFCRLTRPGGPGWRRFEAQPDSERDGEAWWVPRGLLTMLLATLSVYALLFALGFFLYGRTFSALVAVAIAVATGLAVGLRSRGGPMLQSPP